MKSIHVACTPAAFNASLYAALDPANYPGVQAVLDGRGTTAAEPFQQAGVAFLRIGQPAS